MNDYSDILTTVIENGRVAGGAVEGTFSADSLEVEVDFEARERGLSEDEIAEAVAFALDHAKVS